MSQYGYDKPNYEVMEDKKDLVQEIVARYIEAQVYLAAAIGGFKSGSDREVREARGWSARFIESFLGLYLLSDPIIKKHKDQDYKEIICALQNFPDIKSEWYWVKLFLRYGSILEKNNVLKVGMYDSPLSEKLFER